MPGLRWGMIVLPKKIHQAVMEAKYTTDISTSGFIQRALEYYLREFGWGEHAAQARRYGSEKYRKMLSATRKYLSDVAKYGQPNGGVSLWVELPVGVGAEALCSRMLEKNVILTPGSQYDISGEENRHIRLSFLNLSDDKIEVGLKRIGDMIRAMLEEKFSLHLPLTNGFSSAYNQIIIRKNRKKSGKEGVHFWFRTFQREAAWWESLSSTEWKQSFSVFSCFFKGNRLRSGIKKYIAA